MFFRLIFLLIFSACSSVYYQPHQQIYITPDKINLIYQEFWFAVAEDVKLNSWLIKKNDGSQGKNLILQFHGNGENMSTHFVSLSWLTDHSFDLLTYDYRSYGKSQGKPTPTNLREDTLKFLDFAYDLYNKGGYQKLILYGQSLGGAVIMDVLPRWQYKKSVNLLVLDSTFSSYKKMGLKILQKSWVTYLFSPIAYLILDDETAPIHNLEQLDVPKLVIHATNDPVINFSEGEALFKKLSDPKEFWITEDNAHISYFFFDKKKRREKFVNYIKDVL